MKKIIVTFGLISGAISSLLMVASMLTNDKAGFDRGYLLGYTTIMLSLSLVYFGIRAYRDHAGNGEITFGRGFAVGVSITIISCLCYVVAWEILYYNFLPNFWDHYGAHLIAKLNASGASAAAVQAQLAEIQKYKRMYANPLLNGAMTFLEPFPVGLVITLVSAASLRRKRQPQSGSASLSAA